MIHWPAAVKNDEMKKFLKIKTSQMNEKTHFLSLILPIPSEDSTYLARRRRTGEKNGENVRKMWEKKWKIDKSLTLPSWQPNEEEPE